MNSTFQKAVLISIVAAVIGFTLFTFLPNLPLNEAEAFALGLFIGGMVLSMFLSAPQPSSTTTAVASKTIYVGNLPYRANEAAVRKLFESQGTVVSVRLMKDKHTGKRRGFGFVEMAEADADKAISALNDSEFQQRQLKVREAKQRQDDESEENS